MFIVNSLSAIQRKLLPAKNALSAQKRHPKSGAREKMRTWMCSDAGLGSGRRARMYSRTSAHFEAAGKRLAFTFSFSFHPTRMGAMVGGNVERRQHVDDGDLLGVGDLLVTALQIASDLSDFYPDSRKSALPAVLSHMQMN